MKLEDFTKILFEHDEETGIVLLTLNTPERRNALGLLSFLELWHAMDIFQKNKRMKAIIITGAKHPESDDPKDQAFSSGGYFDVKQIKDIDPELRKEIDLGDIAQKKLCLKMWKLEKPIIAAMNGYAIGGGFTMPLAGADLIFMSEDAWVQLPFARLGLVPELASSYLLPRLLGFQKANEILFFGERIPAKDIEQFGLINKVLPYEKVLPYARAQALKLVPPRGASKSLKFIKRALRKPLIDAMEAALDLENKGYSRTITTHDFAEAINARKEKRAPEFKGH